MINRSLLNIRLSYIQPVETCLAFSCLLTLCPSISCQATLCPASLSKFVLAPLYHLTLETAQLYRIFVIPKLGGRQSRDSVGMRMPGLQLLLQVVNCLSPASSVSSPLTSWLTLVGQSLATRRASSPCGY